MRKTKLASKALVIAFSSVLISIEWKKFKELTKKAKAESKENEQEDYIETPDYANPFSEIPKIRNFIKAFWTNTPWQQLIPLRLILKCLHSEDLNVRNKAISFIHYRHLTKAEMSTVLQAASSHLLVHLCACHCFSFPPPLPLPTSKNDLETELVKLMENMPVQNKEHQHYLSMIISRNFHPQNEKSGLGFDNYPSSWVSNDEAERHIINYLLSSLLHYSQDTENCRYLVKNNIFVTLRRVYESVKEEDNDDGGTMSVVCKVINNILLNSACHESFFQSGILFYIDKWCRRKFFHAQRVLQNLKNQLFIDDPYLYDNRVFLVSTDNSFVKVDVVFIHGLRGGAHKTWRQQKRNNQATGEDVTNCWPRDWLPLEVPGLRVLMVQYQNHLSYWSQNEKIEIKSLKEQSELLLASLKKSGFGSKPIILVGHSMGGLLIKQIIVDLNEDESQKRLLKQVKGVVFYSVPHRGSNMVNYSKNASLLLSPTEQVKQLSHGSEALRELHEKFLEVLHKQTSIKVVSFTEGKSTNLPLKFKAKIVTELSSDLRIGDLHVLRDSDHIDVCKPQTKLCPSYTVTRDFIRACTH